MKPYYEQSGVTIYHGDCRDALGDLFPVPSAAFDLLLTDPPYGDAYAADPVNHRNQSEWDAHRADADLIEGYCRIARQVILWGGNYYSLGPSRCWLSWHKPDAVPTMANVEYAWTDLGKNSKQISISIAATNCERVGHPTQKPEALMRWCILHADNPRTIIDPFMGSGTTLVAAKRLGRFAVGIEREERYCEIAAKRLQQEALPLEMGA